MPDRGSASGGEATSSGPTARAVVHSRPFNQDLRYWIMTDRRVALRVMDLITAIERDPFRGIGKPEPLKSRGADTWSRRITDEHRLVYRVHHERIELISARGHYE